MDDQQKDAAPEDDSSRDEIGDLIMDSLRSHGEDPRHRTSFYWSAFGHIFILFILPLIVLRGCMEAPYGPPIGSGITTVTRVMMQKVSKEPKKKLVLSMASAFIFYIPKPEDSKVMKEVEEATRNTYEATSLSGAPGTGDGKDERARLLCRTPNHSTGCAGSPCLGFCAGRGSQENEARRVARFHSEAISRRRTQSSRQSRTDILTCHSF